MITPNQWADFRKAMKVAHDSFNQQIIIWQKALIIDNPFGEDSGRKYQDIQLKGLIQYNWFRTWPANTETKTGTVDKESCVLILNKEYLQSLNLLNGNKYFNFSPGDDYFIINGIRYRASGDSDLSQANNDPVLFFIVLRREELPS